MLITGRRKRDKKSKHQRLSLGKGNLSSKDGFGIKFQEWWKDNVPLILTENRVSGIFL